MGHTLSHPHFGSTTLNRHRGSSVTADAINISLPSDPLHETPCTPQNVLLWYDPDMYSRKLSEEKILLMLSNTIDHVHFYTSAEQLMYYIKNNESTSNRTFFLVISGREAPDILPQIHDLTHLTSVYVYCSLKKKYDFLWSDFKKIKGIYTKVVTLVSAIKADISHVTVFNFYNTTEQKSIRNLTEQAAEFLWFQLLQEILLQLPSDTADAKQEFLTHCRNYYRGINLKTMEDIDSFEENYESKDAIKEYTKDSFVYKIVNQALRTEDVDQLYTLRYYIADLCRNLIRASKTYREKQLNTGPCIKVYHGQQMPISELKRVCANIGALIATNGFLSTSLDLAIAEMFAGDNIAESHDGFQAVILEIHVNLTQVQSIVLADVCNVSKMEDESEILFGLGATFRVLNVRRDNEKRWIIELHATDDGKKITDEYKILRLYGMSVNSDSDGSTNLIIFGQILLQMGEYEKAIKFFKNLLSNDTPLSWKTSQTEEKRSYYANIYFSLGDAHITEGNCQRAAQYLKQSLNLFTSLKAKIGVANSSARLASALVFLEEYDEACRLYQQATVLYKELSCQELNIACCDNGLGEIYFQRRKIKKARFLIRRAFETRKRLLPKTHPDLAMSFYNFGRLCYHEGDNDENARKYLEEALERKRKIFPSSHPTIACNLHMLGKVYTGLAHLETALAFLQEAVNCYRSQHAAGQSRQNKIQEVQSDINSILSKVRGRSRSDSNRSSKSE